MIVRITGLLVEVAEDAVVIERDGVAREVLTPAHAVTELAALRGQEVTLHTLEFLEGNQGSGNLVPRLLGFIAVEDKRFFQRFISVKGIGARKALKALAAPTCRIATDIEAGDAKALTRLPGIGRRAAELIVAELKGKLKEFAVRTAPREGVEASAWSSAQVDAVELLVAWGDPRDDAERWLARAGELHPEIDQTDEWVRAAYRVKTGIESGATS